MAAFENTREAGDGVKRTVVMIHGSLTAGAMWKRARIALEDRYTVVTPDLTGYGATPAWTGKRPFRLTDDLALVEAAVDGLDAPFDLVGHSYGGLVALRYAYANPARVRSLMMFEPTVFRVLADPDVGSPADFESIDRLARAVRRGVEAGVPEAAMRHFFDYWNGRDAWRMLPEEKRILFTAQARTVEDNFAAGSADDMPIPALSELDIPAFVVAGANSTAASLTTAWKVAMLLPDVEAITVGGAGHMLPLTHSADAIRLMAGWLSDSRVTIRADNRLDTSARAA
jgi:lipase